MQKSQGELVRHKSVSAFKGRVNCNLKGSTFDAKHLNNILQYASSNESFRANKPRYMGNEDMFDKVPYMQPNASSTRNEMSMYSITEDNTRPSPCFMTLARDLQKQQIYSDQYDGPSSLLSLSPDRKSDKIKAEK